MYQWHHWAPAVAPQCYRLLDKLKLRNDNKAQQENIFEKTSAENRSLAHVKVWMFTVVLLPLLSPGMLKIWADRFSFPRITHPSFSLRLWRAAMTARMQRGYCTTWGLKSWWATNHTHHHAALSGWCLTDFVFTGGSYQKGLHAGGDRGGGWGWRGGAFCIAAQCWS